MTPEPVIVIVSLLYLAPFLAAALRRASGRSGEAEMGRMAVWTGVLLAAGVVTKITFFPHAVMVLALPGWRLRRRFILAAAGAVIVLISPVWHKIPAIFRWVEGLLTRSGNYGSGEAGLPSMEKLAANAMGLYDKEPTFGMWLLVALLGCGGRRRCEGRLCWPWRGRW